MDGWMDACVYIYIYIYVCVCVCRPTSVCLSVCLPACLPACLAVCLSVCLYVCMYDRDPLRFGCLGGGGSLCGGPISGTDYVRVGGVEEIGGGSRCQWI